MRRKRVSYVKKTEGCFDVLIGKRDPQEGPGARLPLPFDFSRH